MSYSLDVNILLYSSDTSSPFHAQAQSFLQSCMDRRDLFYLTWPTIMGYLRIVTHPSIFDEPLTPEEAMANVETLLNLPHCAASRKASGRPGAPLSARQSCAETWYQMLISQHCSASTACAGCTPMTGTFGDSNSSTCKVP